MQDQNNHWLFIKSLGTKDTNMSCTLRDIKQENSLQPATKTKMNFMDARNTQYNNTLSIACFDEHMQTIFMC